MRRYTARDKGFNTSKDFVYQAWSKNYPTEQEARAFVQGYMAAAVSYSSDETIDRWKTKGVQIRKVRVSSTGRELSWLGWSWVKLT